MSIRVMSYIWESGPQRHGALLVMLALADYSNDAGECWPSIKSIAQKSRMTERGVQKIIRELEAEGWIEIDTGNGRHGCNNYRINPERRSPPEQGSPRTTMQETPNNDAETLNGGSPEPSRTIKNRHCVSAAPDPHTQFEKFWEVHPRPKARAVSEQRFHAAIEAGADPKDVLFGAGAYANEQAGNRTQFIAGSDAWLLDERWNEFDRPREQSPEARAALIEKMKSSSVASVRAAAEKLEAAE